MMKPEEDAGWLQVGRKPRSGLIGLDILFGQGWDSDRIPMYLKQNANFSSIHLQTWSTFHVLYMVRVRGRIRGGSSLGLTLELGVVGLVKYRVRFIQD